MTVAALSSPVDLSQRRHAPLVRILPALSPFLLARWGQRWTIELLEAINGRRSVREYTDRAVDDAVLRELIDAAVQAPSAVNQQPWSFAIVKDRGLLAQISDKAKAHLLKASLGVPAQRFPDRLSDPKFHIFYHAPVLIVISAAEPSDWAVEDCALAAQNLMLAAYAAGLGSCWIGFAQAWLGTVGWKIGAQTSGILCPGRPDHRRPSAAQAGARPAQEAEHSLDSRFVQVDLMTGLRFTSSTQIAD